MTLYALFITEAERGDGSDLIRTDWEKKQGYSTYNLRYYDQIDLLKAQRE